MSSSTIPETNVLARDLAWRMFRDPADADYLIARWSMKYGLFAQFIWHSQQCIEKYLKCMLLMNGRSVSESSHKLQKMFADAASIAHDLIPIVLCPPSYFLETPPRLNFPFVLTEEFVKGFEEAGHPDIRYGQVKESLKNLPLAA